MIVNKKRIRECNNGQSLLPKLAALAIELVPWYSSRCLWKLVVISTEIFDKTNRLSSFTYSITVWIKDNWL